MKQDHLTYESFTVLHKREHVALHDARPNEVRIKNRLYDVLSKINLYRVVRVTTLDNVRTRIQVYKPVAKTLVTPKRG
jgi:hypothetical protein